MAVSLLLLAVVGLPVAIDLFSQHQATLQQVRLAPLEARLRAIRANLDEKQSQLMRCKELLADATASQPQLVEEVAKCEADEKAYGAYLARHEAMLNKETAKYAPEGYVKAARDGLTEEYIRHGLQVLRSRVTIATEALHRAEDATMKARARRDAFAKSMQLLEQQKVSLQKSVAALQGEFQQAERALSPTRGPAEVPTRYKNVATPQLNNRPVVP